MITTCTHCDGARRITGCIPPEKSFLCPRCYGTGKENPTFADLADMAAGGLPDGWVIEVYVERHAGWVGLLDPGGHKAEYPSNHESIEGSFADALEFAIEEGAKT